MPVHKQIRVLRKKDKLNTTRGIIMTTSNSTSASSSISSSHATVSQDDSFDDDSCEKKKNKQPKERYPPGTKVKKYFNGHGWCTGKVVSVSNGQYKVHYSNRDQDFLYSVTDIPRLIKTATVTEGSRLQIYWPREKRYFAATVQTERQRKRENYLICYDGKRNEREWIDLHRHKFRILKAASPEQQGGEAAAAAAAEPAPENHKSSKMPAIEADHPKEVVVVQHLDGNVVDSDNRSSSEPRYQEVSPTRETATGSQFVNNKQTAIEKSHPNRNPDPRQNDVVSPETVPCSVAFMPTAARDGEKAVARVSADVTLKKAAALVITSSSNSSPGSCASARSISMVASADVKTPPLQTSPEGGNHDEPTRVVSGGSSSKQKTEDERLNSYDNSKASDRRQETDDKNGKKEDVQSSPSVAVAKNRTNASVATTGKETRQNGSGGGEDDEDGVVIDPLSDPATKSIVTSLINVGSRVSVFWEDDQKFYSGTVTDRKFRGKPFYLEYDDGEEEWIDLRQFKFRLLRDGSKKANEEILDAKPYDFRDDGHEKSESTPNHLEVATLKKEEVTKETNPDGGGKSGTILNHETPTTQGLLKKAEPWETTPNKKKKRRKDRKAALDALVDKKRAREPDEGSSGNSLVDSSDEESDADVRKSPTVRKRGSGKTDNDISSITVGSHVAVWWDGDKQFYSGIVKKERVHKKPFLLVYDDGKAEEWIDFRQHKFKLLANIPPEKKARGRPKKNINERVGVGSRVAVWWSTISKYYEGTITRKRSAAKPYYIEYDTGDTGHWIDLTKHTIKILDEEKGNASKQSPQQAKNAAKTLQGNGKAGDKNMKKINDTPAKLEKVASKASHAKTGDKNVKKINDTPAKPEKVTSKASPVKTGDKNVEKIDDTPAKPEKATSKASFKGTFEDDETSLGITVGTRVSVYWEGDSKYYEGVVTQERQSGKKRHFLEYDDGEAAHWIDFKEHWVRVLPDKPGCEKKKRSSADIEAESDQRKKRPCLKQQSTESLDDIEVKAGARVAIWWGGDKTYYRATVKKTGSTRNRFFVEYDDGEKEWISSSKHSYRFLDDVEMDGGSEVENHGVTTIDSEETETEEEDEIVAEADDASVESIDHYALTDFVYGAVDEIDKGSRIAVWWSQERRYFDGVVKKIDKTGNPRRPYFMKYDDGDEEWTDLRRRYFRFLD